MKFDKSKVILKLTERLQKIFGEKKEEKMEISLKADYSVVTEIDLYVSHLLKDLLKNNSETSDYTFYSEEDHGDLVFPAAVVDPIDGTRELVKGRPECVVSLALMASSRLDDSENYAWLYNPFSGFELNSETAFVPSLEKSKQKYLGMVSRSEYEKGWFEKYHALDPKIEITPRGSIAFKLGLLASGACDFVLSVSPKNIWDIAGGSILCAQRGIKLYQNGVELHSLSEVHYQGILLWAPEEIALEVWQKFKSEK